MAWSGCARIRCGQADTASATPALSLCRQKRLAQRRCNLSPQYYPRDREIKPIVSHDPRQRYQHALVKFPSIHRRSTTAQRLRNFRQCPPRSTVFELQRLQNNPANSASAEDESDVSALIARLTAEVNQVACEKTKSIQKITNQMKMLALNALIESSRAGAQGAGFAVVAQEVRNVGQQVETIARELESQLTNRTGNLMTSIAQMADRSRGERMVDLSLNAIELIDRNLYERTCDVRWWATDSAVVDCAAAPDAAAAAHVSERLAVILGAYTVYLDLWLCDLNGNVVASGRVGPLQRRRPERRVDQMVSRRARPALRRRLHRRRRRMPAVARQRPGRDLLRQRARRRQGEWQGDRRARDPFRLGTAGPRHRAGRARRRRRQGARAAGRFEFPGDRGVRRPGPAHRTHLASSWKAGAPASIRIAPAR